ncbi:MAG TPA: HEAT repeat domain-containing protein [Gemmatimonadaceae bacterium]|nr:HEAT repeat domain-containing protein [Gemmatimonadaceae bacterium]
MARLSSTLCLITCLVGATATAAAQTLAQRISNAPDGIVRVQFAPRPGTCGNGRDVIAFRKAMFGGDFQSFGEWSADDCVQGPMRVAITVAGGRAVSLQTSVGGKWPAISGRVTDLGVVSSGEAATYFFGIIPQLEGRDRRARLMLPAVLADDPNAIPRLVSLARDGARRHDTRSQAIHWIGILGDARVVPILVGFARQAGSLPSGQDIDHDDEGPGSNGFANAAMAGLSILDDHAGVPALMELARDNSPGVRAPAVFWLGQSGDPRAFAALHTVIENSREDDRIRARAIFSLAHGARVPASEIAYLGRLFPTVTSTRMKNMILQGMAEDESNGASWLLSTAGDRAQSLETRKQALFWAGQRQATPTRDLIAFYRGTSETSLREHAIFVLSQREDDAALNELMRIAKADSDRRMRSKALFWLGQKEDPRVAALIGDKLSK